MIQVSLLNPYQIMQKIPILCSIVSVFDQCFYTFLITDENQQFLRKYRVELINRIKNVTEIVDHLKLGDEQAARVRAERTEQEKMRTLLEFTTSKSAAEDLVLGLWRCASDIMKDLTDSNCEYTFNIRDIM